MSTRNKLIAKRKNSEKVKIQKNKRTNNLEENFKKSMSLSPKGACIITTGDKNDRFGLLVSTFNSASLKPLRVTYSISKNNNNVLKYIKEGAYFVANFLSYRQIDISNKFCDDSMSMKDRWEGIETIDDIKIDGCLSWIECSVLSNYDFGDHYQILGNVLKITINENETYEPLLGFKSKYMTCNPYTDKLMGTKFTHIGLPVHDLEKTINFYTKYTPLRVIKKTKDTVGVGAWLSDPTTIHDPFMLAPSQFNDPGLCKRFNLTRGKCQEILKGFAHLGFTLADRNEIDNIVKEARKDGIKIEWEPFSFNGLYTCAILDPDNNIVEFMANDEGYREIRNFINKPSIVE